MASRILLLLALPQCAARLLPVRLQKPASVERVLTLRGNLLPMGIYATNISIGIPPQEFEVTIDTGSTDLLLPMKGCIGCKPGAPTYDPKASSTSSASECKTTSDLTCKQCAADKPTQCGFSDTYLTCDLSNLTATCSVSGGVFDDVVHLAPQLSARAVFGGIDSQTKNFDQFQSIDGILGLAFRQMGFSDSPLEAVAATGVIENVVQTCLTPGGGLLAFGLAETDAKHYDGPLKWTPIIQKNWYTIWVDDLAIAGQSSGVTGIDLNGPNDDPCIVDSGTNFLSLTAKAFNVTREAFGELCGLSDHSTFADICRTSIPDLFNGKSVKMSADEMESFPSLTLTLRGDVALPVSGTEYLVPTPGKAGEYTLGITQGDCIIGDVHMLKYWIAYDRANMRIGFAPLKKGACEATYSELVAQREASSVSIIV